ncbi:MAG: hypothetical protein ACYDEN_11785 [Acidimicrobiales bacterium]
MGTGFDILLTLHLFCVVGGFGYLAYSGLTLVVGRRRGAALGTLEVTLQVGGLAELLVYGAFVFGVAAVGSSHRFGFGETWVWASTTLYLVAIGVLHGVIRRSQKEYVAAARQLTETRGPVAGIAPEVRRIERLEQRIAGGWGVFNLVVVAVLVLMVFRPGA